MMGKTKSIPENDMKAINESFKKSPPGGEETIVKNASGGIITAKKQIVNHRGHVLKDYRGRILSRRKSWIPVGGKQIIVGEKGTKFDDISPEIRSKIMWMEADFI